MAPHLMSIMLRRPVALALAGTSVSGAVVSGILSFVAGQTAAGLAAGILAGCALLAASCGLRDRTLRMGMLFTALIVVIVLSAQLVAFIRW